MVLAWNLGWLKARPAHGTESCPYPMPALLLLVVVITACISLQLRNIELREV